MSAASWRSTLVLWLLTGAGILALACSLTGLADGGPDASAGGGSGASGCAGTGCSVGGSAGSECDGGGCAGGGTAGSGGGLQCNDGKTNGDETDVDCGGGCPPCRLGRSCESNADCTTRRCDAALCACPDDMVSVPTPISEGLPYCVDAFEVTNQQYDAFLKSNPDVAAQPAECVWNVELEPSTFADLLAAKPRHPVVNVDWCDARAYCAAIGKRLCGKLGGGPHVYTLPQSATNEWYVACSQAGKNTFVYGNTHDPSACVTEDLFDGGTGETFEVGSLPSCEGGYPGIFDMNGNVWEWEDSCAEVDGGDAAAAAPCRRRGGAFDDLQWCARCSTCGGATRARNSSTTATGIRCCAG